MAKNRIGPGAVGLSLLNFSRARINHYVPQTNFVSRATMPPSWQQATEIPLVWKDDEPEIPSSEPVLDFAPINAEEPETAVPQTASGNANLLRILELHNERQQQPASEPTPAPAPPTKHQPPPVQRDLRRPQVIDVGTSSNRKQAAPQMPVIERIQQKPTAAETHPEPPSVEIETESPNLPLPEMIEVIEPSNEPPAPAPQQQVSIPAELLQTEPDLLRIAQRQRAASGDQPLQRTFSPRSSMPRSSVSESEPTAEVPLRESISEELVYREDSLPPDIVPAVFDEVLSEPLIAPYSFISTASEVTAAPDANSHSTQAAPLPQISRMESPDNPYESDDFLQESVRMETQRQGFASKIPTPATAPQEPPALIKRAPASAETTQPAGDIHVLETTTTQAVTHEHYDLPILDDDLETEQIHYVNGQTPPRPVSRGDRLDAIQRSLSGVEERMGSVQRHLDTMQRFTGPFTQRTESSSNGNSKAQPSTIETPSDAEVPHINEYAAPVEWENTLPITSERSLPGEPNLTMPSVSEMRIFEPDIWPKHDESIENNPIQRQYSIDWNLPDELQQHASDSVSATSPVGLANPNHAIQRTQEETSADDGSLETSRESQTNADHADLLRLLNLPSDTPVRQNNGLVSRSTSQRANGSNGSHDSWNDDSHSNYQSIPLDQAMEMAMYTHEPEIVQREPEPPPADASTSLSKDGNEAPNVDKLARDVYRVLRDRLRIEQERRTDK